MHLSQIAMLVATAIALLGVIFRQMGLVRTELNARIDSVRGEINGTRTELDAKIDGTNARIDGLRNELLATMQPIARLLERLDQDARDHLKTHHSPG
ncbi:hypothetical protein [Actinomadura rupiterrae]|uniref:hypothetical protein n=1 Tax=Actinomadura rupiterrae TaxID=559627 RepID=UPI0020A4AD44|nr:hypothetical protein [Actinomadura rupiterrae]MCP2336720.1 uncharacterized small protein (DUF1192 family) [Actinomadura rupiterrae]